MEKAVVSNRITDSPCVLVNLAGRPTIKAQALQDSSMSWHTRMIGASRRGTTYSLVRHHNNGQNSSDNNVMPLKPRNVNAVIAGNVADIYKGDEGM